MRNNDAYQKAYGTWAGNPKGHKPDYERCCTVVHDNVRWHSLHQCTRKRGFGPGEAYCKIHDPAAVAAKRAKSQARYTEQINKKRYEWYGPKFFRALEEIANGHNDARGLAQEVIAKFKEGER